MKEVLGDIWVGDLDVVCVNTNAQVNMSGLAIMGRGSAKEALIRVPDASKRLGMSLREEGIKVVFLGDWKVREGLSRAVYAFPTKYRWQEPANLELIRKSCNQLHDLWSKEESPIYHMRIGIPRPGVGLQTGKRDWNTEVRPILEECLPEDSFFVYHKEMGRE